MIQEAEEDGKSLLEVSSDVTVLTFPRGNNKLRYPREYLFYLGGIVKLSQGVLVLLRPRPGAFGQLMCTNQKVCSG